MSNDRVVRAIGGYQPGLDGLRAIAVFAVAAYHARLPNTSGGFLGVSLFFTLSGFLITGLLLDEHERTGGIDLRRFWTRRFKRLVPAALLGLAIAVVFAATIATRNQLDGLPAEVLASALYVANWLFTYTDQSYAELFTSPTPVQHYWSLAIEEQFYVFMPLVLLGLLKIRRSVNAVIIGLGALAAVSVVWMAVRSGGGASLDRLYYGTDMRAGELLIGAALAAVLHRTGTERIRAHATPLWIVGPIVLAGLMWAWTTVELDDSSLFRGGFAMHAIASAVLVVTVLAGGGPLNALLRTPPLAYLGRISYGIYLFHWPIFLWLDADRTGLDQWPLFALRLVMTIALASASYALVEQPIRSGAVRLTAAPLVIAALFAGSLVAGQRDAFDEAETLRVVENPLGLPIATDDGVLDIAMFTSPAGESTAAALAAQIGDEPTVRLSVFEMAECTIDGDGTCTEWSDTWPAALAESDPDAVVFHMSDWPDLVAPGTEPGDETERAAAILDAGLDLLAAGDAPIIWLPIPIAIDNAISREGRSFTSAMNLLTRSRDDVFEASFNRLTNDGDVPSPEQVAATALSDAALYQRSDRSGLPRVLVVGDSQAQSLAFGLQRWGDIEQTAWVWNRGAPGCPFNVEGSVTLFQEAPVSEPCRASVASFDGLIERFDPDLVIAVAGQWDLLPRRLDEWDESRTIGDPDFDASLIDALADAHQRLSAGGATVVWTTMPCLGSNAPGLSSDMIAGQSRQRARFNETILPELFEAEPSALEFDLADVLCPGGDPTVIELPGVGVVRYDGLHFSVDGAAWFAETYGPELLDMANL